VISDPRIREANRYLPITSHYFSDHSYPLTRGTKKAARRVGDLRLVAGKA
jgi:hypothetical protein